MSAHDVALYQRRDNSSIVEGIRQGKHLRLRQLTDRVEIDDACLGGQRTGGKAGRGSENKGYGEGAPADSRDGSAGHRCAAPGRAESRTSQHRPAHRVRHRRDAGRTTTDAVGRRPKGAGRRPPYITDGRGVSVFLANSFDGRTIIRHIDIAQYQTAKPGPPGLVLELPPRSVVVAMQAHAPSLVFSQTLETGGDNRQSTFKLER